MRVHGAHAARDTAEHADAPHGRRGRGIGADEIAKRTLGELHHDARLRERARAEQRDDVDVPHARERAHLALEHLVDLRARGRARAHLLDDDAPPAPDRAVDVGLHA